MRPALTLGGRALAALTALQMTLPAVMAPVADPTMVRCFVPPAGRYSVTVRVEVQQDDPNMLRARNRRERRCVLAHGHLPR